MDEQQTKIKYMEIIRNYMKEMKTNTHYYRRLGPDGVQTLFEVDLTRRGNRNWR